MNNFYANVQNPENFVLDFWVFRQNTGVIVNMYSQKKLITSTCSNRNIYSLVRISQEIITPGSRFLLENEYCLGKKCSQNLLVNRKEQGIVMLKHLNGLLCVQFNCPKWVLEYGKIEWYCGIKSFTYGHFFVLKNSLVL